MDRADAIVVLGCRVTEGGNLTPCAYRRVATAGLAFRRGMAPWVIASGGRLWGCHREARVFGRALTDAGVPKERILEEHRSLSTLENAVFSAAILECLNAKTALIVTCPWHMSRALADFRAAGVESLPFATNQPPFTVSERLRVAVREGVCRVVDAWRREHVDLLRDAARFTVAAPNARGEEA